MTERDPLYDFERKVEKMELSIYGNGVEGLIARMKSLENEVKDITVWMSGWQNTTNYDDYKTMKRNLEDITKKVYMIGALLSVLMALLHIVLPNILQYIFK